MHSNCFSRRFYFCVEWCFQEKKLLNEWQVLFFSCSSHTLCKKFSHFFSSIVELLVLENSLGRMLEKGLMIDTAGRLTRCSIYGLMQKGALTI